MQKSYEWWVTLKVEDFEDITYINNDLMEAFIGNTREYLFQYNFDQNSTDIHKIIE